MLSRLVDNTSLKYSQLTQGFDSSDNVLFHLKSLIDNGLIDRNDKVYNLTKSGLFISGEFDLQSLREINYKTTSLVFVIRKDNKYLLRGRPFENQAFWKLPGGKSQYGKKVESEKVRLLEREIGQVNNDYKFGFDSIHLKIQTTTTGEFLFDDTLIVYKVDLEKDYKTNIRDGNKWFTKEEIIELHGKWPEIDFCILRNNWSIYKEYKFVSDYHLEVLK